MSRALIHADLECFAREGRLGPIRLGDDRTGLLELLGPPSNWLNGYTVDQSPIWKYGDAEFHFEDQRLQLIHFDWFDVPAGNRVLRIIPWVIRRGLPLAELSIALQTACITSVTTPDRSNPGYVRVTTPARVAFLVQIEGDADELGLAQFGCTDMSSRKS